MKTDRLDRLVSSLVKSTQSSSLAWVPNPARTGYVAEIDDALLEITGRTSGAAISVLSNKERAHDTKLTIRDTAAKVLVHVTDADLNQGGLLAGGYDSVVGKVEQLFLAAKNQKRPEDAFIEKLIQKLG